MMLSWTLPHGIFNGFELFSAQYDQSLMLSQNLTNVAMHTVRNLEPHTRYHFALRTVSGTGSNKTISIYSNEVDSFTRKC